MEISQAAVRRPQFAGRSSQAADRRGPGDRKKYTASGPVRRGRPEGVPL